MSKIKGKHNNSLLNSLEFTYLKLLTLPYQKNARFGYIILRHVTFAGTFYQNKKANNAMIQYLSTRELLSKSKRRPNTSSTMAIMILVSS